MNDSSSVVYKWEPIISVEKYEEVYRSLLEQSRLQFPEIVLVLCEPFILPVEKVKEKWEAYQTDMTQRQAGWKENFTLNLEVEV